MPLWIYNHEEPSYSEAVDGEVADFGHSRGGQLSGFDIRCWHVQGLPGFRRLRQKLTLIYRLNLADRAIAIDIPGVKWLPLVYSFHCESIGEELVYQTVDDKVINVISPRRLANEHKAMRAQLGEKSRRYPKQPVRFISRPYIPTKAEDALSLAGVFGIDRLSERELDRAVDLVRQNSTLLPELKAYGEPWSDMTDEELVRSDFAAPFWQRAPGSSCSNPGCSAKVIHREEERTLHVPGISQIAPDRWSSDYMRLPASIIREDSQIVIAMQETRPDDSYKPNGLYHQMIWQYCKCCHCITVTNQCD